MTTNAINLNITTTVTSITAISRPPVPPPRRPLFTTHGYFPESISPFPIRTHNGTPVFRGNLNERLFGGQSAASRPMSPLDAYFQGELNIAQPPSPDQRLSYSDFADRLQCAETEPDFDHNSGAMNLMKLAPPSLAALEAACAFAETRCDMEDTCATVASDFKQGKFGDVWGVYRHNGFAQTYVLRVVNNTLFHDWPFGRHRIQQFKDAGNDGSSPEPVNLATDTNYWLQVNVLRVLQVPDSIFFMGSEQPIFPWLLPFPSFSYAPKQGHAEMAWPWPESVRGESDFYASTMFDGRLKDRKAHLAHQRPWHERINKAAFFSTHERARRLVWEQGGWVGAEMPGCRAMPHPAAPPCVRPHSTQLTTSRDIYLFSPTPPVLCVSSGQAARPYRGTAVSAHRVSPRGQALERQVRRGADTVQRRPPRQRRARAGAG